VPDNFIVPTPDDVNSIASGLFWLMTGYLCIEFNAFFSERGELMLRFTLFTFSQVI
jgi:hypothetical protein